MGAEPAIAPPPAGAGQANAQVLESFFIGRAFAITLSRRLGEAVVDVVSEVSKLVAENPKRMAEFQVRSCSREAGQGKPPHAACLPLAQHRHEMADPATGMNHPPPHEALCLCSWRGPGPIMHAACCRRRR